MSISWRTIRLSQGSLGAFPCPRAQSKFPKFPSKSLPSYRSAASSTKSRQKVLSQSRATPTDASSAPVSTSYLPPTTGLLSKLPRSWVPYAELIRLDKPAGSVYLFFPCLFGTLLASSYTMAPPLTVIGTTGLFAAGSVIMRGAGCTINDLWDRNMDPLVSRTRLRPIARGAISVPNAVVYTGFQLLTGLAILLQFPAECFWYATPSLFLVATYPLAKRVTNYPQAVLGLAFSWGTLVAFPALGVDLLDPVNVEALKAVGMLYGSCVSWTVLYDMIYAHMDVKDDKEAGIKSIALRHKDETKLVLAGLGVAQIGLLAGVGATMGLGPGYFVLTCGGAAATLSVMVKKVKLEDRESCWWWFKYGVWFTGGAITAGLVQEYIQRYIRDKNTKSSPADSGAV